MPPRYDQDIAWLDGAKAGHDINDGCPAYQPRVSTACDCLAGYGRTAEADLMA
jgi:hypothetical protein